MFTGRLKYLTLTEASRVWMPDLFFSNEKEGHFHNIIMPNVYIRIFPYGSVLYSIRISLTLSCPMNLKLYPLDRQVCSLRMASCKLKSWNCTLNISELYFKWIVWLSDGWTTDDLVFLWKEGDPVQVVKNLHLPRFTLEKFLTDYCNSKTNTGMLYLLFIIIYKIKMCYMGFKNTFSLIRWIQLSQSGSSIQTRVQLLLDPNLYTLLHVGHCILGIILAGSRSSTSKSVTRLIFL